MAIVERLNSKVSSLNSFDALMCMFLTLPLLFHDDRSDQQNVKAQARGTTDASRQIDLVLSFVSASLFFFFSLLTHTHSRPPSLCYQTLFWLCVQKCVRGERGFGGDGGRSHLIHPPIPFYFLITLSAPLIGRLDSFPAKVKRKPLVSYALALNFRTTFSHIQ